METLVHIQYLEIVTNDVETTCALYSRMHGVTFSDPDQNLGGARTSPLASGGAVGIRPPMHSAERPVVRPYTLVKDIAAAVAAGANAGAVIAVPPMEISGHGICAILIQNGIESGLWQLSTTSAAI
jgi:predicted enzyme related to lactoylglutathione lyase